MDHTPKLLNRREASDYLLNEHGVRRTSQTLAKLAVIGGGPAYRKVGRCPMYAPDDLNTWVAEITSRKVRSTSELTEAA